MKALEKYGVGIIVTAILLLILYGYSITDKYTKEKEDRIRLENNQKQWMQDSLQMVEITLKEREVIGNIRWERDSLARALKVKPKSITKFITIENKVVDTVPQLIFVEVRGRDLWKIKDGGDCWRWEADAKLLDDDSLTINRTLYENTDITTQTFVKERKHQFLGIKFGKWQYKQHISSKCGTPRVETINFIKK